MKLTFSLGDARWKASEGMISFFFGYHTVLYFAPDRAASVTITATGSGCSASISFQVIEPNGVHMEIISEEIHNYCNMKRLGFYAAAYITPDTVSFENIQVREGDCASDVSGAFIGTFMENFNHRDVKTLSWTDVGPVIVGKGSKMRGSDSIANENDFGPGTFEWAIPWTYKVGYGDEILPCFAKIRQRYVIDKSGIVTLSKGGASVSTLRCEEKLARLIQLIQSRL